MNIYIERIIAKTIFIPWSIHIIFHQKQIIFNNIIYIIYILGQGWYKSLCQRSRSKCYFSIEFGSCKTTLLFAKLHCCLQNYTVVCKTTLLFVKLHCCLQNYTVVCKTKLLFAKLNCCLQKKCGGGEGKGDLNNPTPFQEIRNDIKKGIGKTNFTFTRTFFSKLNTWKTSSNWNFT